MSRRLLTLVPVPPLLTSLALWIPGCCRLHEAESRPSTLPSAGVLRLTTAHLDTELQPRIGHTLTVSGILLRGNFTFAVGPPNEQRPAVAIYASTGNSQGHAAIASLRNVPTCWWIEVTGELHEIAGDKPFKALSETERAIWPLQLPAGARYYWVDVTTCRALPAK